MKILTCFFLALTVANASPSPLTVADSLEIAKVPADFRVGFSLLTTSERQYAAYYDAERRMTVASRALDYRHKEYGSGTLQFDASSLTLVDKPHPIVAEISPALD